MASPFSVRSFRFQWPADLLTSWAFEMEALILGWYVLVTTGSVQQLATVAALAWLGSLFSPFFGLAGDRVGHRNAQRRAADLAHLRGRGDRRIPAALR
jgi:hypothetical protein